MNIKLSTKQILAIVLLILAAVAVIKFIYSIIGIVLVMGAIALFVYGIYTALKKYNIIK